MYLDLLKSINSLWTTSGADKNSTPRLRNLQLADIQIHSVLSGGVFLFFAHDSC